MRIAIVINTSWNIHNFRLNFIKTLLKEGHEIHTVAPRDEYTAALVDIGCHHNNVKMDSRGANPLKDSALIFELFTIYRKVRPDVILHYTIKPNVYGTLAASLLRIPVINNVCGLGTVFLKENLVSKVAVLLYKISFRFAKRVFFQNSDDLSLFVSKKLVKPEQSDLVPGSGIDLNHFFPAQFKRNKKFTFLMISRLISDKGVLEFVDAIKRLKSEGFQGRFQLLGALDPQHKRGIPQEIVNQWIEADHIEYLGSVTDVRQFIHQADCVVLPSYREGTPRTLLEAASSSKPIIATDVPGCNNVVTHQYNGLLCRLKDVDDLAARMKEMANFSDEELKAFGENGRMKVVSEYDETFVIKKYLDTLANLAKT